MQNEGADLDFLSSVTAACSSNLLCSPRSRDKIYLNPYKSNPILDGNSTLQTQS